MPQIIPTAPARPAPASARVIDAWPALPEETRRRILELVDQVGG
ncbi:MAG: hypothetical protein AB1505_22315 [Candidatus Latescibacterota bacterium]